MTRWLHVCLTVTGCAIAASAAPRPGERPITDADEVLAIYTNDLSLGGGSDGPKVILAAWPDGLIVWSADRLEGGPPYREGKIEPGKIAELFKQFDSDGLFSDEGLNQPHFGPDSSYTTLLVNFGKKRVEMQSWHELYEASGKTVAKNSGLAGLAERRRLDVLRSEPAEYIGYRFVWSETRGKLIDLIPDENQPSHGQPVMAEGKLFWQPKTREARSIDSGSVPAGAVVAFVVHPAEIARHKGTRPLIAALDRHFSLTNRTTADMEEIHAVFTDFGAGEQQPRGYVAFRSGAAILWDDFTQDLFGSTGERIDDDGKTYFVADPRAAYYLLDERTMVTSGASQIVQMMETVAKPQAEAGWANRWRQVSSRPLAVFVDLAAFEKELGRELEDTAPDRKALIAAISPLWKHARQMVIEVGVEDGLAVSGAFYCDDAESALKVRAALDASLALARDLFSKPGEDSASSSGDDEAEPLIARNMVRALVTRAKIGTDGAVVRWHTQFELGTED